MAANTPEGLTFAERLRLVEAHEAAVKAAADANKPLGLGATPFVPGHGYAARFPLDALPQRLRELVVDVAVRQQVPVDLPALAALGCISAVAGPRFLIRRDITWRQPLILQIAVAMDSGAAKSPAVDELTRGIEIAETRMYAAWKASVEEELAPLQAELDKLTKAANRDGIGEEEQDRIAAQIKQRAKAIENQRNNLNEARPAPARIRLTGDTTPEALTKALARNGGSYAIIDSEGTFFNHMTGSAYRGGKAANATVVLKGYDGDTHESGRVGEGKTDVIRRTSLVLVITPQPPILASTLGNKDLTANGFVNRFIVCVPGDLVGQRSQRQATYYLDAAPNRPEIALAAWWADLLTSIAGQADVIGRSTPDDEMIDLDSAPTLNLTRDAFDLSRKYEAEFELRMAPDADGGTALKRWGSKHLGRVVRLAGILHLAAGRAVDEQVDVGTMEAAIAIGEWSVTHYLAAGSASGLSAEAGRIMEYVESSDQGMVTRAAIGKAVFCGRAGKNEIDGWVSELVSTGRYTVTRQRTAGRPREWLHRVGVLPPSDEQADAGRSGGRAAA